MKWSLRFIKIVIIKHGNHSTLITQFFSYIDWSNEARKKEKEKKTHFQIWPIWARMQKFRQKRDGSVTVHTQHDSRLLHQSDLDQSKTKKIPVLTSSWINEYEVCCFLVSFLHQYFSFGGPQPIKIDLNKKSFPKQKTFQTFNADAQGF